MDIFYSPMGTVRMNLYFLKYMYLSMLLKMKTSNLINKVINNIAKKDVDMMWKLNKKALPK